MCGPVSFGSSPMSGTCIFLAVEKISCYDFLADEFLVHEFVSLNFLVVMIFSYSKIFSRVALIREKLISYGF